MVPWSLMIRRHPVGAVGASSLRRGANPTSAPRGAAAPVWPFGATTVANAVSSSTPGSKSAAFLVPMLGRDGLWPPRPMPLRSLAVREGGCLGLVPRTASRMHDLYRPRMVEYHKGVTSRAGVQLLCGPLGVPLVGSVLALNPNMVLAPVRNPFALNLGSVSYLTSWQHSPPGSRGGSGGGGGGSSPGRPPRGRLTASIGAIGTGLVLLAGKGKYVLSALKLTKFASLGSMLFTVGTYSMFFGLPYAAGMVGLILVHECGHALVMRHYSVPFSPMVFVPFLGASVMMKRAPRDAYQEAMIAFGGPVLGSIGAVGVAAGATVTDSQLLYALADFGYMINLFNLLPIGMMDGGRITGAISPYAGVVGLGIGGMMAYEGMVSNPIFYVILLAGGYQTFSRFYHPEAVLLNYYRITPAQRLGITGGYFGLVGAIFAAMAMNATRKKSPEQLQRERDLSLYRYD